MDSSTVFLLAADTILLLHMLIVAFIVIGLVLIFIGKARAWSWIRNPWFRLMHLVVIGVVVIQSWLGVICPLTTIEMALRSRGSDTIYSSSFMSYWIENILYYQAPPWVFAICYMIFGAVACASWFWIRPRGFTKSTSHHAT
ncbi:DUF2784 domain-containing protein [Candidatus Endoriftia persephone]|jgi:hypothetical protein|uniref:DUF2784 family protein n=1 Tax=Candidatus Endoriftia persephonae TaxID=393765 RepID=A0A9J6ZUI7_9GAMM|nr:DUF2784 domain-containing protein [Candidatus Endoriftia persephone]USF86365.1 DUF2784 family protein [Candidatus Endoriftia persephone]